ncbi:MAG: hypothetical protein JNJ71_19915 [Rubrivivax sp.]|nr:hypothetical protein [Rubrivivax sp.]
MHSWALYLWVILLAACGVGGEGTGGPNAMVALGRVEGFGSLVVAGQRVDDKDAQVQLEVDPRRPQARTLADLRLGMTAEITGTADASAAVAQRVRLLPEVVGPLERMEGGSLIIAGQTVGADVVPGDATVVEGLGPLARLSIGTWIEVHGQRDANDAVRATRLARALPAAGVRVSGRVSAVDAAARRFSIGALRLEPEGALTMPSAGDRVIVWGAAAPVAGILRVETWRLQAADAEPAATALLSGVVEAMPAANRARVRGVVVELDALTAAERAAVTPGAVLRVRGSLQGGLLQARSLERLPDATPLEAELTGNATDVLDGRRFVLRGSPIDAASASYAGFGPSNIANGVAVSVRARIDADRLVASTVSAPPLVSGEIQVQAGAVFQWDAAQRLLRLDGLPRDFRLPASASLKGGTEADLRRGAIVVARGRLQADLFVIDALEFPAAGAGITLTGAISELEPGTGGSGSFGVLDVEVSWTPATRFLGPSNSAADLATAGFVRVTAVREGTGVRALEVDTRPTDAGSVRLRGTVTSYVSLTDMRVAGQRVDASAASFDPPSLRNELQGAYVDVEGTLDNGVLRARRISDP